MKNKLSRRDLLGFAAGALAIGGTRGRAADFPLVDYHVHLDNVVTLEKALQLSKERGVTFGIVEHAGTKENSYSGLLSTDDDLRRYLAKLEGKPVLQAEGLDWMSCFRKETVAQLDYVLTDALTFPEKNGKSVRLWNPDVKIEDKQDFMERYTDFHLRIMATEPIDILANPTFLPQCLQSEFDALWIVPRMKRIIDAAVKYNVAIEINSRYRLPRMPFLKMAHQAGAKFSFGSNIHGLDVGKLDYCLEAAQQLGIKAANLFKPAPSGKKPIELRRPA
jgi:hypothetical protein